MEKLLQEKKMIEIIPQKLYWMSSEKEPKGIPEARFFNIDEQLIYYPFFSDFGPLNISETVKFVKQLDLIVNNEDYGDIKIIHHTSEAPDKRANAAWLICAFMLVSLKYSSRKIWNIFKYIKPIFKPFRDASYNPECSYECDIYDCLRGLEYAIKLKWFDIKTFNLEDYEHYEQLENGDLNWIVPNKIIAFSSPVDNNIDGYIKTEDYIKIFKDLKVKLIIRLNNPKYNEKKFKDKGIDVKDLFFEDGSCPAEKIIETFLDTLEKHDYKDNGPIAIHCKAGLGRTGTLIAMYCMKNYKFKARDFIGWIRLCRPGSVLGPQQHFINKKESEMFNKDSEIYDSFSGDLKSFIKDFHKNCYEKKELIMNKHEKKVLIEGQKDQGIGLVTRKTLNKKN